MALSNRVTGPAASPRRLGRVSEIAQVSARHGLGYLFDARPPWLRLTKLAPDGEAPSARGQHLRELLDELGPTFVKFGQFLSTRPDVVPADIAKELQHLQDDAKPIPFSQVQEVVESELGLTLERAFIEFEEQPVAAASIGQVHCARLPNGDLAAVKVQRPQAPRQVEADIELLYRTAGTIGKRVKTLRFIDTVGLVDEFARTIRGELDYRREAANATRFGRNFAGDSHVSIPQVYPRYSTGNILTLEWQEGTELAHLDLGEWTLESRRWLAYAVTEAWLTMFFRHGFFHGDPHPANILCMTDGRIGLVDFGQAGRLTADDLSKLTALLIDAVNEKVEALPRHLIDLGVQFPREREQEFAAELSDVYNRYMGAKAGDIDPLQLIREGFALVYRMNLKLPTRFALLDKAIAMLGSVGIEIYPNFNVVEVASPYTQALMRERFSVTRIAGRVSREARSYAHVTSEAPHQVHDVLEELRDGRVEIGFRHEGLEALTHQTDIVINRFVVAVVAVGGVLGSAILAVAADSGPMVLGIHIVSVAGFSLSTVLGLWLAWAVIRSGRI
ncbi:MAG: AarF/UbiB family protein [Actinomycetia bacterium]|nr:AarF/UbiB family protein [Actinomycetes bacterium]